VSCCPAHPSVPYGGKGRGCTIHPPPSPSRRQRGREFWGWGGRSAAELLRFIPRQRLRDDYKEDERWENSKKNGRVVVGTSVNLSYFFFQFWGWLSYVQIHAHHNTTLLCVHIVYRQHEVHIPRVPQCLSPCPNWDPHTPPPASECVPPPGTKRGGRHTRLRVRGCMGGLNSDDWRKSIALCLLCGRHDATALVSNKYVYTVQ
jgi:hypothetical protein